jgi:hypothetical protein
LHGRFVGPFHPNQRVNEGKIPQMSAVMP